MLPRILGEHPLAKDSTGALKSRIATVFPMGQTIVTLPGIHATQRLAYVEWLKQRRAEMGLPPPTREEQSSDWQRSVDLIMEDDTILIRPDPDHMDQAFHADELLQQLVPKWQIRFLLVSNEKVRTAIKRRGECWRISPLPKTPDEMRAMIAASKIAIGGLDLYYYSKAMGTRFLTYDAFSQLGKLDDEALLKHLTEIRQYCGGVNRYGRPEMAFFMAGRGLTKNDFTAYDFERLDPADVRAAYEALLEKFHNAVPPEFRQDDLCQLPWRNQMYAALIGEDEKAISEESLLGLSSEFFMQIEWLPGGRIEQGELIFDPVFEMIKDADDPSLRRLCDEKCRGFIFNFVREFGDLEYVNIGRVVASLSHRPRGPGRRDVYIAQVKQQGIADEILKIIRMQKWGVREHLDDGKDLLDSILRSEEYTEYILDRRLGCRQLGMNLPAHVTAKRISERYTGPRRDLRQLSIWSPYFERDYIRGMATDKIPPQKLADPDFAVRLAQLLGEAAAPNMIVGRCDLQGRVAFDDGDEVVVENDAGQPIDIVVSDQTGTFVDYRTDLEHFAAEYARPVLRRFHLLTDPEPFATAYVNAFVTRFSKIQLEYRKRKRAFDTLFQHRPRDEAGSFAYRWECVLDRLRWAAPQNLGNQIRHCFQAELETSSAPQ
ncbi:MAG: hypothetical protein LLF97_09010 [Planctomycetaceae bacterium]|nr:hypothetical protein [Planctomycetaceae bacterium]